MRLLKKFGHVRVTRETRVNKGDLEMFWLRQLLVLVSLVGGCTPPLPASETSCCAATVPGSMLVHLNGEVAAGAAIWHQ
jgi:hypothetical protein